MKHLYFIGFFFSTALLLNGCIDHKKNAITKVVNEWQNKKIILPSDMLFTKYGKDTIQYKIPSSSYKILMYADSIGCTSCKLQLQKWKEFIIELDSLAHTTIPVIFIFHPKDLQEISYLLKREDLDIPVHIDKDDRLNKINRFPTEQKFQTFLLDKKNKVVLVGNPTQNLKIKELYLATILNKNTKANAQIAHKTIIEANKTEFNLGTISKGDSYTTNLSIRNLTEIPFVIHDIRTSCGCVHIEYDKQPLTLGSTTHINITYNADVSGYFNKTISIYGNIDKSPLIIRLKGIVQ